MKIFDKFKELTRHKQPWEQYYTKEELNIVTPEMNMYEMLLESANNYSNLYAYNYFGNRVTYKNFIKEIDKVSDAFRNQGIRRGDVVSICMPNTPEAIISIYALNKIGAIAETIHPLSSEVEIKNYLLSTGSVMLIMIDSCYEKVRNVIKETNVYKTIVVSAKDSMPFWTGFGYEISQGFKISKPSRHGEYIYWKDFIRRSTHYTRSNIINPKKEDPAIILHSGGTTGSPKSIVLSNASFNTLAVQAKVILNETLPGETILGILPIFHGFGLGVCIHSMLYQGLEVVLIPQFDSKKFDKLIIKHHPCLLIGVPTLFEALMNIDNNKLDLSSVKYAISGGDSLSVGLGRRINTFLLEHNSKAQIAQGYGMTECLASVCVGLRPGCNKESSIGIPFPGNYLKIVKPNSQEEVKVGEEGEICVSGPTVMMGYLDNEKETNEMLQTHKDGRIWLHTGDMGRMDKDGVFYYVQRIKRMLISSGFNVYPGQIESVINSHEAVLNCTVIGVPHPYKVQVAKAIIVLKNGYSPSIFLKNSIKELCEKNLAKYSIPHDFEFRKSLPKTAIGKVDFKKLQEEEDAKRGSNK